MPNNKTDFVTLLHDIDYLRSAGLPQYQDAADARALYYSDLYTPEGFATTFGLTTRRYFGAEFNKPIDNYSAKQTRQIGEQLWRFVANDRDYRPLFFRYNVPIELYNYSPLS